jgi:hypothetical protein
MFITNDELTEILQKHKDWLNGVAGGIRADLSGIDLKNSVLRNVNLKNANLYRANLSGCDLTNSNLMGANLNFVNLKNANLENASLYGAELRNAKGIIHWQSPIGMKRTCYSVKYDYCVMHKIGCFWGDTGEAVTAIRKKYGNDSMYEQLLLLNTKAMEE